MIIPFVCPAKLLKRFTPEQLEDPKGQCMCGRNVPLGAAMVVWTHPANSDEYNFYEVCTQGCYVAHVTEGNC